MTRERSHIRFTRRQQFFAWVILSVYLPTVLLASLHVHSEHEYAHAIVCDQCQTDTHHSGHIVAGVQHHGECLSCRLLTTQVDLPNVSLCLIAEQTVGELEFPQATEPVVAMVAHPSLRAPPHIL